MGHYRYLCCNSICSVRAFGILSYSQLHSIKAENKKIIIFRPIQKKFEIRVKKRTSQHEQNSRESVFRRDGQTVRPIEWNRMNHKSGLKNGNENSQSSIAKLNHLLESK